MSDWQDYPGTRFLLFVSHRLGTGFVNGLYATLKGLGRIGLLAAVGLMTTAFAQEKTGEPVARPPVPYASVTELNGILDQIKQTAAAMHADLGSMRIERWKTDASNKRQTLANVDSIQRNLQSALPELSTQLRASPEDLAAGFKMYRNLDALYEVFGSVVESAGAFGSKDEFQSLSNDMNGLENARRAMAERVQKLAGAKEEELARLRAQVKTLSAALATAPPPPKKVVVDDTEPTPKKPGKKTTKPGSSKSSTPAKKPSPANNSGTPPSQ